MRNLLQISFCQFVVLLFLPVATIFGQSTYEPEYEYFEVDGELIRVKKAGADPSKNSGGSAEDNYSPKKSNATYKLQSKGMKIVELDHEGEPVNQGKRYAIVIGINDYKDPNFSNLSKARNDAKVVGKTLLNQGQFDQVYVMTDDVDYNGKNKANYPTKLNIEERVDSVLRFAEREDLIVFFFSGHGISDLDDNGYLVAVDSLADKPYNSSVKVEEIVQKFKKKGIKKTLVILDACREKLYQGSKSTSRNSIREKRFSEAEVSAIFYSTRAGFLSYEDPTSDYGVFTKYLVY